MLLPFISVLFAWCITSVRCDPSISTFPNALSLSSSFDPIKAAYWTGLPHHRRTPFSVSPDGKLAYLAYLDSTYKNVVVQQVDVGTFDAVGTAVNIAGFEAAGLVAQNDGFALFATVAATGTTDLPTNNYPIAAVIRYKNDAEAWRTPLNGPGVHVSAGLSATPDANGDLVYSSASGLYGAYFVVTAYTGDAAGHFGDSVQYVDDNGALQDIPQSSTFGCSHNTGIAIEAADAPPFATVCAEDQGSIWLNTDTRYMSGVKIANENTTNGVSGEPMGGMSGSYSNLALFPTTTKYIFAWQSRGAIDLTQNAWLGSPYTQCSPRWLNHNVAISTLSSKDTLTGPEATSVLGATDGDSQVNWITESSRDDHQNVRVAALNSNLALVSWETLTNPACQPVPLSCTGTYAGTSFQFVDSTGKKVGGSVVDTKVFVGGDMVFIGERVCWPYVDMTWDLSAPKASGALVTKMSFACAGSGSSTTAPSGSVSSSAASSNAASSHVAPSSAASSNAAAAGTTSTGTTQSTTTSPVAAPPVSSTVPVIIPSDNNNNNQAVTSSASTTLSPVTSIANTSAANTSAVNTSAGTTLTSVPTPEPTVQSSFAASSKPTSFSGANSMTRSGRIRTTRSRSHHHTSRPEPTRVSTVEAYSCA